MANEIDPTESASSADKPDASWSDGLDAAIHQAARQQAEARAQARDQTQVEASKYDVGQRNPAEAASRFASTDLSAISLADVDDQLAELPNGYGVAQLVLIPRDPHWGYLYWDLPEADRQRVRSQGGRQLALRLYDVTDIDVAVSPPNAVQQHNVDELAHNWYLEIPASDRDYVAELGYTGEADDWFSLVRSATVHVPAPHPTDWTDDQMVTIRWDESLQGRHFGNLARSRDAANTSLHEEMFRLSQGHSPMAPGSLGGLPHTFGDRASGIGLFSGAVQAPVEPRNFWLQADAELIVYGATEPGSSLTIDGEPVPVNPDGTFRLQLSFQDGHYNFPIMAVATDGEQMRQVHLRFQRMTPVRRLDENAGGDGED